MQTEVVDTTLAKPEERGLTPTEQENLMRMAAFAMQGMVANYQGHPIELSRDAYDVGEAMMAEHKARVAKLGIRREPSPLEELLIRTLGGCDCERCQAKRAHVQNMGAVQ